VRGGKIYGVIFENRKFRFKTLGIDIEKFKIIEKEKYRKKEIEDLRQKRETKFGRNR
jgi:hypothetical protein